MRFDFGDKGVKKQLPHLGCSREDGDFIFSQRADNIGAFQRCLKNYGTAREERGHESGFKSIDVIERQHGERHVLFRVLFKLCTNKCNMENIALGKRNNFRIAGGAGSKQQRGNVVFISRCLFQMFVSVLCVVCFHFVDGDTGKDVFKGSGDEHRPGVHSLQHFAVLIRCQIGIEWKSYGTDCGYGHIREAPIG
ncbi:MAG: hypothetical protein A4E71_00172 [Smithella sp. PtaU1.Bin162]|nr:MAG: hypothetical protein A4E71_00172 [Smithella sp. PtaU1.Bin162]